MFRYSSNKYRVNRTLELKDAKIAPAPVSRNRGEMIVATFLWLSWLG